MKLLSLPSVYSLSGLTEITTPRQSWHKLVHDAPPATAPPGFEARDRACLNVPRL